MSFPAILIGAALLIVSIPIVARPFLGKKRLKSLDGYKKSHKLRRSYEQTLLALRDLDFDHQLGVVAEADYQQIRTQLLAEAAQAYEQAESENRDLEQFIESAVRDRRQILSNSQGQCDYCRAILDPTNKFCSACGSEASSSCPHCQLNIEQGDKFCTFCGAQLAIATGAAT